MTIYRHAKTGVFSLLRYARNKEFEFREGWGPLLNLTDEEMRKGGLDTVLKDFQEYPERERTEPCEMEKMSKRERHQFERERRSVGLSLQSNENELWISAMYQQPGGAYLGSPDKRVILKLPSSNEEFYEGLMEALRMCD